MNIKKDNEDEGFQGQDQTCQLFSVQCIQHPLDFFPKKLQEIKTQSQPPLSWYTTIKNYKSPQFINNCYSVPNTQQIGLSRRERLLQQSHNSKEEIELEIGTYSKRSFSQQSHAQFRNKLSQTNKNFRIQEKNVIYDKKESWQAQKDQPLQEYFKRGFICIYDRFGGAINTSCNFYSEHSKKKYKTFIDKQEEQLQQRKPQERRILGGRESIMVKSRIHRKSISDIPTRANTEKDCVFVRQIEALKKDNNLKDMRLTIKDRSHIHDNSAKFHFTSCFESGNLSKVYQHCPCSELYSDSTLCLSMCKVCYQTQSRTNLFLLLSNDTNTLGYNQWFYFKCTNLSTDTEKVIFIICNYTKKILEKIDQTGICCFSQMKYQRQGKGWFSIDGANAGLKFADKNRLKRFNDTYFRSMQFQYEFQRGQTVYFSLSLPYTFTKLTNLIRQLNLEQKTIGMTSIGNPLISLNFQHSKANKTILILARQHPSQTSGSYVMEGVMRKLNGDSALSSLLKKKFRIVVIPMCNPDGVIHGNSRTNLSGVDINRKWDDSAICDKLSSEVYAIIRFMKSLGQIQYLIDLHGHSKKLNSFAYFSGNKRFASLFANQMGNRLPCFKFNQCTFDRITQPHENTLRGIAGQKFKIDKAFTIQTSIHGWSDSDGKAYLFSPRDLMNIGQTLIDSLAHAQFKKISLNSRRMIQQLQSESVCSDSDPQGDYLPRKPELQPKELPLLSPLPRKLKTEQRKFQLFHHNSNFKYQPLKNVSSLQSRERLKTDYPCNKINVRITPPKSVQIINKFQHRYLKTANLKKLKKTQPNLDSLSIVSKNPRNLTL